MAKASFNWGDPLLLDQQLSDDECAMPLPPTARSASHRAC